MRRHNICAAIAISGAVALPEGAIADSMSDDGIHYHTATCSDYNAYVSSTVPITFRQAKVNEAMWISWLILSGEDNVQPQAEAVAKRYIAVTCPDHPGWRIEDMLKSLIANANKLRDEGYGQR